MMNASYENELDILMKESNTFYRTNLLSIVYKKLLRRLLRNLTYLILME